ncbi:MAG: amidohydrolase family protein [Pseudorhodoplanes sp.]
MSDSAAAAVRLNSDRSRAETLKFVGGTIVAYQDGGHRILENGEVIVSGDRVVSVGPKSDTAASRTIELKGRLLIPGMISTHAHIGAHEATRFVIDGGRREFMRSGFLNYVPTQGQDGASLFAAIDRDASVRFGFAQLLRNGVTTVLGFAPYSDDLMVDVANETGLRLYFAPTANAGRYHFDDSGGLRRVVDDPRGEAQLDAAAEFIARHHGAGGDRIRGIVVVDEFYNSTPSLRRAAKEVAGSLKVGLTMHFCEQLFEFHETVRLTGLTPVQILEREGILGPEVILAHCIYIAGHSMACYPYVDDLKMIAESGSTVAHSPVVFARRGVMLESFQRYQNAGVNVAIGTDVFPMDIIEEMRFASIAGKIADRNHEAASAAAVFDAATVGGARALGRDDIGRIAPGAKADLVVVDLGNIWTVPYVDPIKALVTSGHPSMIDMVLVDGRVLVEDGRLLEPSDALLTQAGASMASLESAYAGWHHSGHAARAEYPPAYPNWRG